MRNETYSERMYKLREVIGAYGIKHFTAEELIKHKNPDWPGDYKFPPPKRMAKNIGPTLAIADEIRDEWGDEVIVLSGYRSPLYNEIINGSSDSQHIYFRALDLKPANGKISDFIELTQNVVDKRRQEGKVIGRGLYNSFVHIDTGYYTYNRNWDRR